MRKVVVSLAALAITGCAHSEKQAAKPHEEARAVSRAMLNSTNSPPGSVYNVKIYVVNRGDTLSSIGNRFRKSVAELRALNPKIDPNRLRIGERIRVAEDKVQ